MFRINSELLQLINKFIFKKVMCVILKSYAYHFYFLTQNVIIFLKEVILQMVDKEENVNSLADEKKGEPENGERKRGRKRKSGSRNSSTSSAESDGREESTESGGREESAESGGREESTESSEKISEIPVLKPKKVKIIQEENNEDKPKRKRRTKKNPDTDSIESIIRATSNIVSSKESMSHWKLADSEIKSIAEPLSKILVEYELTKNLEKYGNHVALVTACASVVVPRTLLSLQIAKSKKETKKDKGEMKKIYEKKNDRSIRDGERNFNEFSRSCSENNGINVNAIGSAVAF